MLILYIIFLIKMIKLQNIVQLSLFFRYPLTLVG
jgi:hypothetical protein